jgi:hypothetical protein
METNGHVNGATLDNEVDVYVCEISIYCIY